MALTIVLAWASFWQSSCLSEKESPPSPHYSGMNEYCFKPSSLLSIGVQRETTTPQNFLRKNQTVEAVINGIYFGKDFTPLGIAYVNGQEYANGNRKQARGYFSIDRTGKIQVTESLPNKKRYKFVIGTQPLLVKDSEVHKQAKEKRYSGFVAYRSAIGTKEDDVCFAVSANPLEMQVWAELLRDNRYRGALNLDGGPISQLAVRRDGNISVYGSWNEETRLVIFSYHRQ